MLRKTAPLAPFLLIVYITSWHWHTMMVDLHWTVHGIKDNCTIGYSPCKRRYQRLGEWVSWDSWLDFLTWAETPRTIIVVIGREFRWNRLLIGWQMKREFFYPSNIHAATSNRKVKENDVAQKQYRYISRRSANAHSVDWMWILSTVYAQIQIVWQWLANTATNYNLSNVTSSPSSFI